MSEKLSKEQAQKIIGSLDKLLQEEQWEESNFLRSMNKKIQDIRDSVALHYHDLTENKINAAALASAALHAADMEKIYISLYASDGSVFSNWEWILANLPSQTVSRSIYSNESDVQELIKTKPNLINEAYVSFMIKKHMVVQQPSDKIAYDKLGKPLLVLRDKALLLENIIEFVHSTGVYQFKAGKLVLKAT